MLPPAPGRLSTTTCWPQCLGQLLRRRRGRGCRWRRRPGTARRADRLRRIRLRRRAIAHAARKRAARGTARRSQRVIELVDVRRGPRVFRRAGRRRSNRPSRPTTFTIRAYFGISRRDELPRIARASSVRVPRLARSSRSRISGVVQDLRDLGVPLGDRSSAGVPAGANSPYHVEMSKPGSPASAIVGSSGTSLRALRRRHGERAAACRP